MSSMETAKSARSYKDWNEPNVACAGEGEGQSREGNQMHDFVDSIWRWGRLMDGPKHDHC